MIGILDISADARGLLMNIASGGRGQLQWYPHPHKEWYAGDPYSQWREYEDRPVWVWRSPDGNLGEPASLLAIATLRVLQAEGLVTEERTDLRACQPVLPTAAGKRIINWLAYHDGWMPDDHA